MPPKITFDINDDKLIIDLFNESNHLKCKEIEQTFKNQSNRSVSYKVLKNRFDELNNANKLKALQSTFNLPCSLMIMVIFLIVFNLYLINKGTSKQAELRESFFTENAPSNSRVLITRVPKKDKIIQASSHQGDIILFGQYAGIQCSAMVLYSMYRALITPPSEWNTEVLNLILFEGNLFYINILREKNISMRILGIDDLLGVHLFGGDPVNVIKYNMFPDAYNEDLVDLPEEMNQLKFCHNGLINYNDILNQCQILLNSECQNALFICNGYSYGLLKHQNLIYLFDSHSKSLNGDNEINGKSSLRSFVSINRLVTYMIKINQINAYYQIYYIQLNVANILDTSIIRSISSMSIQDTTVNSDLEIISEVEDDNIQLKKRKKRVFLTMRGEQQFKKKKDNLKLKKFRESETQEQHNQRLVKDKLRKCDKRKYESVEEYTNRLNEQFIRTNANRASETVEHKENRLEKQREYQRNKRANETEQEKMLRLQLEKQKRHDKKINVPTRNIAATDNSTLCSVQQINIGFFNLVCPICQALYNGKEANSSGIYVKCCETGKIQLPVIEHYHDTIRQLLLNDTIYQKHFLENIRHYNSLMAFAGIKTEFDSRNYDNKYNNRRPFLYKCHGEMYFNVPPVFNDPNDTHKPQTAQFYVMDSTTANLQRTNAWRNDIDNINNHVLLRLEKMITEVNPFYHLFRNHSQELQAQLQTNPNECCFWLQRQSLNLRGEAAIARKALLTSDVVGGEIAAVFKDTNSGLPPEGIKVAIYPRNKHRQLMHICDPNIDPMCFPLLFPFGEAGFGLNIEHLRKTNVRNRTTPKEFYRFRLHFRYENENLFFHAGKLFQEYVVHAWIKIESNNLSAIRRLQGQMRIADYDGLMNHKQTNYTPENVNLGAGRAFILNSNFPGSDRNMKQNYYDAMTIANKFGKSDFFITFTSNPKWPEISEHILPGRTYLDRPDICSRVYEMKRNHFKNVMLKEHIMGVMKAFVDAKEYQLRGLPHDHTLWWLEEEEKILNGADIDRYIRAELPDPETEPELFEIVTKYMLHGPCTREKPCMQRDGVKCSKGFPKPYSDTTTIIPNGFPLYRRRNNGRIFVKQGFTFTNQHVVPYNPYLLKLFNSHINVEYCGNLSSIAYVMKYVCKGNDKVSVVQQQSDKLNSATIQTPINTLQNEQPFIEDLIMDELENDNNEAIVDQNDVELNIPLHDQELYVDQNQLNDLIRDIPDCEDYVDVNNFIDEIQVNQPTVVDINNNDPVNIDNNFNRPSYFTAYDEIKQYTVCRYVSSIEAIDKIFGFKRIDMSHSIYRLSIHLPNQQNIVFNQYDIDTAKDRANARKTMLTAWFELNKVDVAARRYLYTEIPELYVYYSSKGEWTPRKQGEVITRLHTIHPKNKELYHLRLLLLHVRGAQSFDDLKTVHGAKLDSFTSAAVALNLVENDQQWNVCVQEIINQDLPHRARYMFAMICIHCNPARPSSSDIWDRFKHALSIDFVQLNNDTVEVASQKGLQHIKYIIELNGQKLSDFGLPEPDPNVEDWRIRYRFAPNNETVEESAEIAQEMIANLNRDQESAYNAIYSAAMSRDTTGSKLFYLDGPGGSGKTYLINCLRHALQAQRRSVIATAFTGIASSLLVGGTTIHSKFRIPVPTESDSASFMHLNSNDADLIREASLILMDEASMIPKNVLKCVDNLLQHIMNNNCMFGGKCLMLAGDFRQCTPVSEMSQIEHPSTMSIKYSNYWEHFSRFTLVNNVRANPDQVEFKNWLLKIGNGEVPTIDNKSLIRLPDNVLCELNIIHDIYGEDNITVDSLQDTNVAILCPTNKDSLEINDLIVNRLEGDEFVYYSTTRVECDDPVDEEEYPIETALETTPNAYPPHKLVIKVGAILILLKNWCVKDGLCNGTRLRVTTCYNNSIRCAILYGPFKDQEYLFNRSIFRPLDQSKDPIRIIRTQFPFRLAFAMTINKSQGQTFDRVGLLLREPVFSHGQLYVAASRVRSFESLKILVADISGGPKIQGAIDGHEGVYTHNVVDYSVLG